MQERTHLVPFAKGYDPRRVIPNTTGMKYRPSAKRILKKLLDERTEEIDGIEATRLEKALYLAIKDSLDTGLDPIDRHRGLNIILDRTEGKPTQRVQQSGTIKHEFTGRPINEIPQDEWLSLLPFVGEDTPEDRCKFKYHIGESISGVVLIENIEYQEVRNAEFEDMPETANSERE